MITISNFEDTKKWKESEKQVLHHKTCNRNKHIQHPTSTFELANIGAGEQDTRQEFG
jgi:hypothetical protein